MTRRTGEEAHKRASMNHDQPLRCRARTGRLMNLERFVEAQDGVYERALAELRGGRKQTHWMWFVFPQIRGLGVSPTAQHYAIQSLAEAREYLEHPLLGARLRECAEAVVASEARSAEHIFGG